jgi:hypothetical protein
MNKKALEAFAKQAAKGIKSEQDLTEFRKILADSTLKFITAKPLVQRYVYPSIGLVF